MKSLVVIYWSSDELSALAVLLVELIERGRYRMLQSLFNSLARGNAASELIELLQHLGFDKFLSVAHAQTVERS